MHLIAGFIAAQPILYIPAERSFVGGGSPWLFDLRAGDFYCQVVYDSASEELLVDMNIVSTFCFMDSIGSVSGKSGRHIDTTGVCAGNVDAETYLPRTKNERAVVIHHADLFERNADA